MHLTDVNVLLALGFEAHAHHPEALTWLDEQPAASCAVCRLAQNGFLRLSTNPSVFADEAVTMSDAWDLYDAILDDDRFVFVLEPHGMETAWRHFTAAKTYSTKLWSDAYLAAFAVTAGMGIVSFDRGFSQFDVSLTNPA